MMQSKYARNCVKRILKYGNENVRHKVLEAMYGNVVKFSSHTLSAPILDYAYSEIADRKEKINFEQEFYGDMYKTVGYYYYIESEKGSNLLIIMTFSFCKIPLRFINCQGSSDTILILLQIV